MKKSNNKKIMNDYEMNQKIAQNIIDIINSGNVQDWKKCWTFVNTKAENYLEQLYDFVVNQGGAALLFDAQILPSEQLIPQGFYATFKQLKRRHLHLLKGASGVPAYKPCTFYKELTKAQLEKFNRLLESEEELKEEYEKLVNHEVYSIFVSFEYVDDNGKIRQFDEELIIQKDKLVYKRFQWVLEYLFNIKSVKEPIDPKKVLGIEDKKVVTEPVDEVATIAKVEKIKDSYIQRANLKFIEEYQGQAFYRPSNHSVTLPTKKQFAVTEEYYQVMFHEFAHSTGHYSLLNRSSLVSNCGFGTQTYSKEELVAELSSLYTLSAMGILTDDIVKNSVSYIQGWGSNFGKSIQHNIMNTIEHSRKATNLILNLEGKNTKKGMAA